ncbi:MAG: hypothetical protein QNK37_22365 [Acidobacteriota bacterium]|nr:hypothetical protein [Acidobacteriota bacterium]
MPSTPGKPPVKNNERFLQIWRSGILLTLVLEETTGRNYEILRLTVGSLTRHITVKPEEASPAAVQLIAPYVAEGFTRRGKRPAEARKGPMPPWGRGVHHEAALRVVNPGGNFSLFGEICPDCASPSPVQRFKDRDGKMVFRFLCCRREYY